jgi:hypothetical protein
MYPTLVTLSAPNMTAGLLLLFPFSAISFLLELKDKKILLLNQKWVILDQYKCGDWCGFCVLLRLEKNNKLVY